MERHDKQTTTVEMHVDDLIVLLNHAGHSLPEGPVDVSCGGKYLKLQWSVHKAYEMIPLPKK